MMLLVTFTAEIGPWGWQSAPAFGTSEWAPVLDLRQQRYSTRVENKSNTLGNSANRTDGSFSCVHGCVYMEGWSMCVHGGMECVVHGGMECVCIWRDGVCVYMEGWGVCTCKVEGKQTS